MRCGIGLTRLQKNRYSQVLALKALAPTQTEMPFKLVQLAVLLLFIVLGIFSTIRFRRQQFRPA